MSLFTKNLFYISDYPEYREIIRSWIIDSGYFSVRISPSYLFGIKMGSRLYIYNNILDKLINIGKEFYIYDLNYESKIVKPFHKFITKERSRYKINYFDNGWKMYDPILYSTPIFRSINDIRGGIIGKCTIDESVLRSIFTYCTDPIVIGNASVICGKNALNIAKSSREDEIFYVIIGTLDSGLDSITIISKRNEILKIFDIASRECKLTNNYLRNKIEIYTNAKKQENK